MVPRDALPRLRLSIAVLCNRGLATTLARRVAALYVSTEPAAVPKVSISPPIRLTAQAMASYTGTFFDEQLPEIREIVVDSGKLFYVGDARIVRAPITGGGRVGQERGVNPGVRFVRSGARGRQSRLFPPSSAGVSWPHPDASEGTSRRPMIVTDGKIDRLAVPFEPAIAPIILERQSSRSASLTLFHSNRCATL